MSNAETTAMIVEGYRFAARQRVRRAVREPFYVLHDHEYAMMLERWGVNCMEDKRKCFLENRLEEEASIEYMEAEDLMDDEDSGWF